MHDGYNLRIKDLRESDAGARNKRSFRLYAFFKSIFSPSVHIGEYVCQIETYGSPVDQKSQLEILGTLLYV